MFLTRREPGVPLSLFRPYPLPFSPLFLLLFLTLPFLLCFFHWSISAVVSGEAFYLQNSFFHSSTTPVVGGTLRWAWKTHFLIQYKKKLIISGDFFLLKRSSLGTSDIQGCYSPKGITYMIYTLIHGRDPIPWRITYMEYRFPVKILISFWGTPPNSIGFHCKIVFVFIVLRHRSWGVPFGELEKLIF